MRFSTFGLLLGLLIAGLCSTAYGQDSTACDRISKADIESVLGTSVQGQFYPNGCTYSNFMFVPGQPQPPQPAKIVNLTISLSHSDKPDPAAVNRVLKTIDEKTYDDAMPVPDLGDMALWGSGKLFVFSGGTTTLNLVSNNVTFEQARTLAVKALGGDAKTGFVYEDATRVPLTKPVLGRLPAKPTQIEQLKFDLTAKAETGNAKAQFALGNFYEFGMIGPEGLPKPDYPAAAYWYQEASDRGETPSSFALAVILRDGLGMTPNPDAALGLLRKAAVSGFVPAMVPLSYVYAAKNAAAKTIDHTFGQRASRWAQESANAGDPDGHLLVGYLWNKAILLPPGGNKEIGYKNAMQSYMKAADGGNCVAMMNIGGLYFNGDGVPQDKAQAQTWFTKAEMCSGSDLEWMRDKAARYRERATAGRLPAVQAAAPAAGAALAEVQRYANSVQAMLSMTLGVEALNSNAGPGMDANYADLLRQIRNIKQAACLRAGMATALGCQ